MVKVPLGSKICSGSLKSASSIGHRNAEFLLNGLVIVVVVVLLTSGEAAECLRMILLPFFLFKQNGQLKNS